LNQLILFLLDHLILDFDGEVTLENVQRFLETDKSPLARDLKARVAQDRDVGEFLVPLADCLRPFIAQGLTPERVREQVQAWVEA
jgi:hypothetical protein